MTKIIGIVGWADGAMFGVNKKYLTFAQRYGSPMILLPTDDVVYNIDLLILPGGPDIPYNTYGVIPDYNLSKQCPFRDYFEKVMLPKYIEQGTSIFGICRGFQAIAAIEGAKIIPNISVNHPKTSGYARYEKVHTLYLTTELKKHIKSYYIITDQQLDSIKVNSLHHQGVEDKNVGNFVSLGYTGVTNTYCEVMHIKGKKIAGVQYHPEELNNDIVADVLIKTLLK